MFGKFMAKSIYTSIKSFIRMGNFLMTTDGQGWIQNAEVRQFLNHKLPQELGEEIGDCGFEEGRTF